MESQIEALKKELGEGMDWTALENVLEGEWDEEEWERVVGTMLNDAADKVSLSLHRQGRADGLRRMRISRSLTIWTTQPMMRTTMEAMKSMPLDRTVAMSLPMSNSTMMMMHL